MGALSERRVFDFRRAWKEVAAPGFIDLKTEFRLLYDCVAYVACDCVQRQDCRLMWPEDDGELRAEFDKFDISELAEAAHVIYFYGHWGPRSSIYSHGNGAHWRFSNYADQVLRTRIESLCDVSEIKAAPRGEITLSIVNGLIRGQLTTRHCWMHNEITVVSANMWNDCRSAFQVIAGGAEQEAQLVDAFDGVCGDLEKALWPDEGPIGKFKGIERYMVPESQELKSL